MRLGSRLECPNCHRLNPAEMLFCLECGERLAVSPSAVNFKLSSGRSDAAERSPIGERRHMTMIFCDIVGSTALAARLDLEETHEVIYSFQETCARVIAQYDGFTARYMGDGVLVYFGYPQAHEDDARRAAYTALGILEELARLNNRLESQHGLRLSVRIGIHSGPIVVGRGGGGAQGEPQAFGPTINFAARLQAVAEPNSIVMSEATLELVRGLFIVEPLGLRHLKGFPKPVPVYRLVRASGVRSRLDHMAALGLTPLVDRQQEMADLLSHWQQAKTSTGHVVLLSGDAGTGKSRLVLELREKLVAENHTWLECRGSAYHQQSAFHPIIELLRQGLLFEPNESADNKIAKLERGLKSMGFPLAETMPLFTQLLSLPLPAGYAPLALSSEAQRRKTLEAMDAWLHKLASLQPVVMVMEDLQWMDPSTIQLIDRLVQQTLNGPILMLFTFRSTFDPPQIKLPNLSRIVLPPLPAEDVRAMVANIAGGKKMPREVLEHVVTKTDGVPIFVEELTKMVLESGILRQGELSYELANRISSLAIPETLQDSLMARLDNLAGFKSIAQLGAALGREFSYELLSAVSPLDSDDLAKGIHRLVEAGLLYERGQPPQSSYMFKHALIQDAAYGALLKKKRKEVHRKIVAAVEEKFPEIVVNEPEILAYHSEKAGLVEKAVRYCYKAGLRANAASAYQEAASHLNQGLELLKDLPPGAERSQQELGLLMALGVCLVATRGYASNEVQQTFASAYNLCQKLGRASQLFLALFGLWMFHVVRSNEKETAEVTEQLLDIAQRSQDPDLMLEAHGPAGIAAMFHGGQLLARHHISECMSYYNPESHRIHAFIYGQEPGTVIKTYAGLNYWLLGYPDQALTFSQSAVETGEQVAHPFSLAAAVNFAAVVRHYRREVKELADMAGMLVRICTEQGFPLWLGAGVCELGWVTVQMGDHAKGIGQIQEGLSLIRMTGCRLTIPYHQGSLIESFLLAGMIEEGLNEVEDALKAAYETLDRYHIAELYRLKGELLLASSHEHRESAEACFRQAIGVAAQQSAKSLELRAALSLSRLLARQNRRAEACQVLGEVYDWFTEGRDTVDHKEAQLLLDSLS